MIFFYLIAFLRIQNYKNPVFSNLIISCLIQTLYNSSMNRGESFHSSYPTILYKGDMYDITLLYYPRLGYPWNINILLLFIWHQKCNIWLGLKTNFLLLLHILFLLLLLFLLFKQEQSARFINHVTLCRKKLHVK